VSHFNLEQVEQLKQIGAHLRQFRQKQSISIKEIATKTLIRMTLLTALEEGKIDQLPEPVIIRGFIQRYGDTLGLDGAALAKTFPTNIVSVKSSISERELPTLPSSAIYLYILYILVLTTATCGLFFLNRSPTAQAFLLKQISLVALSEKTVAMSVPYSSSLSNCKGATAVN
jgi:cytoskeletal protein RodZ